VKLDKHAEISIVILVIGVFVVCTLALISFFAMNIEERNSFVGVNLMQKINFQIESFLHGSVAEVDVRTNAQGQRVIYQEEKGIDGFWIFGKEVVLFSAEYAIE